MKKNSIPLLVWTSVHLFAQSAAAPAGNAAMEAAVARQREQALAKMNASIQKQVAAVRHQINQPAPTTPADSPDFFVMEAMLKPAATASDCDPLSQLEIHGLAERAGKSNGVSPNLIEAVIRQESSFRPCVVSNKGAQGLMQLMPDTATDLGVGDALDAEQNVSGGAKLLRTLMDRYGGDLNRVLGAYNAGPARVDAANGVPPFPETITYVDKIMREINAVPVEP